MLVRDVMTREPVAVTPQTPVKAALALLARHRITSMPVLSGGGRLRGMVSEADLIRDLVQRDPRAHELPVGDDWRDHPATVGEVMTPHAVTVRPETELSVAVDLITSTSIKSVPVVADDDVVVGMVSRSDVVRVLATADEHLAREVDAMLVSVGLGDWLAEVHDGRVALTGPDGSPDRVLAQLVAGTVPGVLAVRDEEPAG